MKGSSLVFALIVTASLTTMGQVARPVPATASNTRPAAQPTPVDPKKAAERLERQVALAESAVLDASSLRLGENRAYVSARAGALVWKSDQKAAGAHFQRAIAEIVNAQVMAEAEARSKSQLIQIEQRIAQQLRPTVLNTIANFDPEMALEGMHRTRSASLQRALMQADPSGKVSDTTGSGAALAQSEMMLEQRLMLMAAEKNPERAVKMLQDSIKKGLSMETLPLLKKLYAKDPESANSLASDTLSQLMSVTFSNNPGETDAANIAASILTDALRTRPPGAKELQFNEAQIRSLALRYVNFTITQDYRMNPGRYSQALPIAQKFAPGSVAAIQRAQSNSMPPAMRGQMDPDVRRMMTDPKITPAEMLQQAKTMSADVRPAMYQNAAAKMAQNGDLNGAVQLLSASFSGSALESATTNMMNGYVNYLIGQNKFADAETVIDSMPDPAFKRQAYINLATRAFTKNAVEQKEFATAVLGKARSTLPSRPEDNGELMAFTQLVAAYATVSPDDAFSIYEALIPQLNELADANAITQGFQGPYMVRSGEFMIINGGGGAFGFQFDLNVFRSLARADVEKTQKLMDGFARREIRALLKLQLAENGLPQ